MPVSVEASVLVNSEVKYISWYEGKCVGDCGGGCASECGG